MNIKKVGGGGKSFSASKSVPSTSKASGVTPSKSGSLKKVGGALPMSKKGVKSNGLGTGNGAC